jgi:glycolate oxidase FAD binding subunit
MSASLATGTAEIGDRIRDARARREPLRIVGRGTWLDAGQPCTATTRLDVAGLSGITRYEPGDFVLTARAGTTLGEIASATAEFGQWVTLDPPGGNDGTIGAVIATASYGPLASAYGTPRDHILGCEFISGAGDVVRAGGQVVKNVAGFDLVRLVTGAWGTLGVITEVTLRVRARPEVDRTLAITLPDAGAAALWRWLRDSEFTPLAAELVSPSLARALGVGGETTALVRFGGNETLVRAAVDAVQSLGDATDVENDVWTKLRSLVGARETTFRVSTLPSLSGELWTRAARAMEAAGGFATATPARGVVRCALGRSTAAEPGGAAAQLIGDWTFVGERVPASLWPMFNALRANDTLEQRVRRSFDPDGILNPGIAGA